MTDNSGNYLLGSTIKEALGMVIRCHHELHDIVMLLQDRVLELEMKLMSDKDNVT